MHVMLLNTYTRFVELEDGYIVSGLLDLMYQYMSLIPTPENNAGVKDSFIPDPWTWDM